MPSCPTDRPIVLTSRADLARIASCTALPGVVIRSGAALDTSRLGVVTIRGDLSIGPTVGMQEATFGKLRVVEGAIRVSGNGLLQGLFFSQLQRADSIDIDGNVALTTISLPQLTDVRGAVRVTDNASLEALDMPMLRTIGQELVVAGDPQLTLLEAPQLQRAASVRIDAPKLSPELADRLRAASGTPSGWR